MGRAQLSATPSMLSLHSSLRATCGVVACALLLHAVALAQPSGAGSPVSITRVAKVPMLEELPLVGSVVARRTSNISSQVEGLIAELLVEEGVEVRSGQPLFRLDRVLAEIAVSRAAAELAEAEARLKDVERKLGEARSLLEKKHIPETTFETARIDVEAHRATADRLRADLSRQQELLRRHTVRAPFDGVIVGKLAEVGQWVRSDLAVLELAEIATLRIEVPLPQERYATVQIGQPGFIEFDALAGEIFQGEVVRKIPLSRDQVRTFPVWIDFPNHERLIAPGMSARVNLSLTEPGALSVVVPNDALVRRAGGDVVVWVMREKDAAYIAVPAQVRVGRTNDKFTEIVSGPVEPGDWVVVRGNETLRPQQPIRIAERLEVGS